jgi:osmotically-inducible protein OsmY
MRPIWWKHAAVAVAIALVVAGCSESRQEKFEKAMRAADTAHSTLESAKKDYAKQEKATEEARNAAAESESALATSRQKLDAAAASYETARAEVAKWADDAEVSRLLQQRLLADGPLEKAAVAGRGENGVAVLEGTVPDAAAAERAVEIARETPGVVDVQSRLALPMASEPTAGPPAAEPAAPMEAAPEAAPEATPDAEH